MKKLLLALVVISFAVTPALGKRIPLIYSWEDLETVLGLYGSGDPPIIATNVGAPDSVYDCLRSLKLEDNSPSGTPQAYIAWIRGLSAGDTVSAGFGRCDVTPDVSPSVRIWGHWNDTDSCTGYNGSAGGNPDYGPGAGWDFTDHTWVVEAPHTGLVVEARTYSNPGDIVWIDYLCVSTTSETAVVIFPSAGPSATEPTTWGRLKSLYR